MSKTWKSKGFREWNDYDDCAENSRKIEENKKRRQIATRRKQTFDMVEEEREKMSFYNK